MPKQIYPCVDLSVRAAACARGSRRRSPRSLLLSPRLSPRLARPPARSPPPEPLRRWQRSLRRQRSNEPGVLGRRASELLGGGGGVGAAAGPERRGTSFSPSLSLALLLSFSLPLAAKRIECVCVRVSVRPSVVLRPPVETNRPAGPEKSCPSRQERDRLTARHA